MLSFHSSRLLVLTLSCAAHVGCADDPSTTDSVREHTASIQGGYENPNDPAVVGMLSGPGMCSGSLIAPNLVLTAQHCVTSTNTEYVDCATSKFGEVLSTTSFGVTTEWDGLEKLFSHEHVKLYFASAILIPPGDDSMCGRDVALVLLTDKGVPPTEALPINPRVDEDVQTGEVYRAVGFGATSPNGAGAGVRRGLDDLIVRCSGDCATTSVVNGKEWRGDTGVCGGDSGGPALDAQGRVIGVVSRGGNFANMCMTPVYGSVFGWADWIKEQALMAAEQGGYEPAPWVTGGSSLPETDAGALVPEAGWEEQDAGPDPRGSLGTACDEHADCQGEVCVSTVESGYCSQRCSVMATACPSGMRCDTERSQCVYAGDFGQACALPTDCRSRICLDAPEGYCSVACVRDEDCPATATCVRDTGACEIRGSDDALELGGGCTLSPQPAKHGAGAMSTLGLLALWTMAGSRRRRTSA